MRHLTLMLGLALAVLAVGCRHSTATKPLENGTPAAAAATARPDAATPPFPLAVGARWIYQGTVKWTAPNRSQVRTDTVTWTMEVLAKTVRGHVTGWQLRGVPTDLAWYEAGAKPAERVLLQVGAATFYLLDAEDSPRLWKRLEDAHDELSGLELAEPVLQLELPLQNGQVFGETGQLCRLDRSYCWHVTAAGTLDWPVQGLAAAAAPRPVYEVVYQSLPDTTTVSFCHGVGIVRFRYRHHGTVAEADVRLVEFHPAPATPTHRPGQNVTQALMPVPTSSRQSCLRVRLGQNRLKIPSRVIVSPVPIPFAVLHLFLKTICFFRKNSP